MALTQFSTHKNPLGNDRPKTTLSTGAYTGLKRQFERWNDQWHDVVGNGACIAYM